MKYILVLTTILSVISFPAHTQEVRDAVKGAAATAATGVGRSTEKLPDTLKWKKGGDVSLNFSQISFSNWAAGGENSLALSSSSNLFANYKKNKMIWENYAFMAYGVVKAGDRPSVKNSDQINIGSRVGYQMVSNWFYTAALLVKTQFAPGYKYTSTDTLYTSNFLAPAYLFLSFGLDYKPSSKLSVSFSPIMGKATFVNSNSEAVLLASGITRKKFDEGKRSRYEFGGGIVFNLNGSYFSKRVTYSSQLELFSNYIEKPQNLDVVWDFQFRVALSKFISSGVRLNMMYYDNQKIITKDTEGNLVENGAKPQMKQYFEIGLFYGF